MRDSECVEAIRGIAEKREGVVLLDEEDAVATAMSHGLSSAPLAAGARLIAAMTPRRRHPAEREAALHRRPKNGRRRGRGSKNTDVASASASRLVLSQFAHARDPRRSAKT